MACVGWHPASMAKKFGLALVLAAWVAGSAWSGAQAAAIRCSTAPADRWLIIPKKCIGPVPWTGSEVDFVREFGAGNVKRADTLDSINSEGETGPGIVLFPADPLRSVNILWQDPVHRRGVGFCYLLYLKWTRPTGLGYWHLASGIRLGMDIHVLEHMNHRSFTIRLSNIDIREGVGDWQGGRLANERAFVGLSTDQGDQHIDDHFSEIKTVRSSDRDVRAANLWVDYIAP